MFDYNVVNFYKIYPSFPTCSVFALLSLALHTETTPNLHAKSSVNNVTGYA